MSFKELEAAVMMLDQKERAQLAHSLLKSLNDSDAEDLSEQEIEEMWIDEALRRDAELEAGKAKEYPLEEVLREIRSRLK